MADVARRAGVSAMTVSRALKGTGTVTPETQARILQAVAELGYVLDKSAGALSSKKTGFVSVLIPSLNNSTFSDTVHGLIDVLDTQAMQVLIGTTGYSRAREEAVIETMLQRRPEGIVVTGGRHTPRARAMLTAAGVPVIETWEQPAAPIDHVVGFSNAATVEDLMARLVDRGYRRIAFIEGGEGDDPRGEDRRAGYERAVARHRLERTCVIAVGRVPISMEDGARAVVQLVETWPEVEAVICVSDGPAFGAIMECHRRGWAVPGRLAIAGFGDFELARQCWPSITTVSVGSRDLGRQAGSLMLEAIAARYAGAPLSPRRVTVAHTLVERDSTARRASPPTWAGRVA
ncbi:LacI family DNA-binding transcriptional regulator [Roseospira marina]|uniref:LacI family DNA-binding transcriptional regulator n=1 Tax=Roseospira marina TaxID=140057 RepID=A0A5M6IA32_9PROT|nr:LacI family DNA-binding transcriptional regulator [Roseospira marina]KAA5605110.1 LacI family DNA-binding transcriptional regulator [Roseospira marina]MBB4314860.1 LacI family gluconate utilization system Gnt-I transcriptional repressor [Roseospira marina]MBB5087860.1 LacI family gluconate utilization system Gnt-I transcriptional repressor [Roseospira marina]